jgi:hypothetical protein
MAENRLVLETVLNPVYANAAGTRINCGVKWKGEAEPWPFTADANDSEAHGRQIYALIVAGNFGPIAPMPTPTLEALKAARRLEFNRLRETTFAAGVQFNNKLIETDSDSVSKLNGAVTMALIAKSAGQPFNIDWTCADDSTISLGADDIIALGMAVGNYADQLHQRTRVAKAALDAAETAGAVAAIVW